jgi:lipoate-protein ligase A
MSPVLHVIRDGACDGPTNMARDEQLLYSEALRPAALRLYGWSPPTISLGYFQRYDEVAALPEDVRGLAVVRRPTGGGAILHDREVTYCLVIDDSLAAARTAPAELYRLVHECWRAALREEWPAVELAPESYPLPTPRTGPFFCFAKPGRTDLIIRGRKLLGSAQRRVSGRVLQHGSLLLGQRFASHPGVSLDEPPAALVAAWAERFVAALSERLGLRPMSAGFDAVMLAEIERRVAKYAGEEWLRLR